MNHRRGQHFRHATIHQQNRHTPLDAFARDLLDHARALAIHSHTHNRRVAGGIKSGRGIGQSFAGDHDLLAEQQRFLAAIALGVMQLGAKRHLPLDRLIELLWIVIAPGRIARVRLDHAYFQRSSAAQNILGARGVLHAG